VAKRTKQTKRKAGTKRKALALKRSPQEPEDFTAVLDAFLNGKIKTIRLGDQELDGRLLESVSYHEKIGDELVAHVYISKKNSKTYKQLVLTNELLHYNNPDGEHDPIRFLKLIDHIISDDRQIDLSVSSIIIPDREVGEGLLIKSASVVWASIVAELKLDWSRAFEIPPEKWEEIIAGAFDRAGFDQVILTPRSGDYGRDVIAISEGVGCIKIIGSVKAYKPGHLVKHDDVRALLHVMNAERDTSKAILTTTSGFAPRIKTDPFIAPYLPTRLELIDGEKLREWLKGLTSRKGGKGLRAFKA
jgi:restriction system protein